MMTLPVAGAGSAMIDDADYERLSRHSWWLTRRYLGYAGATIEGRNVLMHRLLLDPPRNALVDHIDGNALNNQRANLRLCDHGENMRNRRKAARSSSRFKGVSWSRHRGLWVAQIYGGSSRYLGGFESEADAARAYDAAALDEYGEFACLNFPTAAPVTPSTPNTATDAKR